MSAPATIPATRRPSWLWRILLLGLALLLALVGAEILIVGTLSRRPSPIPPVPEVSEASEGNLAPSIPAFPTPASAPASIPGESAPRLGRPADSPGSEKPPLDSPREGAAPFPEDVLRPVGGLLGANLLQGQMTIGLVADAVEGELYPLADARRLLGTVTAVLDAVEEQVASLPASRLAEGDRKELDRFRGVLTLLRTQIKELRLYWDTDEKDHAERYHKARNETKEALAALLAKKE